MSVFFEKLPLSKFQVYVQESFIKRNLHKMTNCADNSNPQRRNYVNGFHFQEQPLLLFILAAFSFCDVTVSRTVDSGI